MELYLFRPEQWAKLYNCSRVNIDDLPLWERRRIVNGTVMLLLFFIFEILYLPCLVAIWKHREHSCYKFLFFIGVTDVLMLPFQGLISALYSLFGVVFCSNPAFNFLIGSIASALFATQTSANLFLALDRLIDSISRKYSEILFSNGRAWLWTITSSLFGLYYFLFAKPALFSPTYGNWFMNPYHDYVNISINHEMCYVGAIIGYYDALLSFGFPIIYALFVFFFLRNQNELWKKVDSSKTPTVIFVNPLFQKAPPKKSCTTIKTNVAKILFIQVAAINGINVSTFVLYTIMQHLPMSKSLIIVGFYCNYLMFGFPPIIYLLVNRTIRNECRKMVKSFVKCWF